MDEENVYGCRWKIIFSILVRVDLREREVRVSVERVWLGRALGRGTGLGSF